MTRSLLIALLLTLLAFTAASIHARRTLSEGAIDTIVNTWVNSVTDRASFDEESDAASTPGQIAASFANSKVGSCYSQAQRMGNPCYDCSSLVYLAYKSAGKNVPTTTRGYPGGLRDVTGQALQTGDILWRSGHVGIYVGGNQVVNAENPKSGVKKRDLGFYTKYLGFTRVYRV